jgi:anion-transporting  ArsA/GET3 family ATPase
MLSDLSTFFRSLSGILEAFGQRTRGVAELLRDKQTTFVLVTSPEPEPAQEAIFLAQRLAQNGMRRGGVIVNRVHFDGLGGATVEQAHEALAGELGDRLAARVAANLADFDVLVTRDRETVERVTTELDEPSPVLVPHLDEDISDLTGLARLSELLFS